jgi:hypothetical protein
MKSRVIVKSQHHHFTKLFFRRRRLFHSRQPRASAACARLRLLVLPQTAQHGYANNRVAVCPTFRMRLANATPSRLALPAKGEMIFQVIESSIGPRVNGGERRAV